MTAPFTLGPRGALVAASIIGLAFGACLERSGLGSARKLMGQFDLTDLAVFKVMFSAIVTAMLGLFWLTRLGFLDIRQVYLPDTFLLSQLAGGALFGVGFALAGLCPGTSCVAAATGRVDGAAVMLGMFAGVLAAGLALPWFQRFYLATPRGGLTLPRLLGIPEGVVVLVVVGVALTAFAFTARIERWATQASRGGDDNPPSLGASGASGGALNAAYSNVLEPSSSATTIDCPAHAVHAHGAPSATSRSALLRDDVIALRALLQADIRALGALLREDARTIKALVVDDVRALRAPVRDEASGAGPLSRDVR